MEALFQKHFVILCAIVILILSGIPGNSVPKVEFEYFDKLVHIGMYAVFTSLLYGYFVMKTKISARKKVLASFILAAVYGVTMEILQDSVFAQRSFDVYDIISNIMGSFIGIILMIIFINSKK